MPEDQPNIVWLASYPKSGNTWLRFFLTALLMGRIDGSQEVVEFIPDIGSKTGDAERFNRTGDCLVKTHLAWNGQHGKQDCTAAFIYIIRNPLDVMASNFNYHMTKMSEQIPMSVEEYRRLYYLSYIDNLGDPQWKKFGYGGWYENVMSWLGGNGAAARHPFLLIRYETMLQDTLGTAQAINRFLSLNKSDEELQQAITASSFDSMKRMEAEEVQERKNGFFLNEKVWRGTAPNYNFMNKGQAGSYKTDIPEDIREEFIRILGAPMRQFEYL